METMKTLKLTVLLLASVMFAAQAGAHETITDATGRKIVAPECPDHVICSGAGCLRLLTYLKSQDRIAAVDDMEKRTPRFETKPYAIANPQFKTYPVFGEFRGHDNPELIVSLDPMPQVIFKTFSVMGHDPAELQNKTGIPVVVLNYGDMVNYREELYRSVRLMGRVMCADKRAEEVVAFFESAIADLNRRTADADSGKTCYVGGISFKGPHGFRATEPFYPPFVFTRSENVARDPSKASGVSHAIVAKEKIIEWDPDIIFLDLASLASVPESSAFHELKTDPVWRQLGAVKSGRVYGVLPYNSYAQNFGSVLANAYYVGTVLFPERFGDIDPKKKADEIYTFLVGKPVFDELNKAFGGMAFTKLGIQ